MYPLKEVPIAVEGSGQLKVRIEVCPEVNTAFAVCVEVGEVTFVVQATFVTVIVPRPICPNFIASEPEAFKVGVWHKKPAVARHEEEAERGLLLKTPSWYSAPSTTAITRIAQP